MKVLNTAYVVLSDLLKRQHYDDVLRKHETITPPANAKPVDEINNTHKKQLTVVVHTNNFRQKLVLLGHSIAARWYLVVIATIVLI